MNDAYLATILLAPVVSEKSTRLADQANQVVFKVRRDATKPAIKRAVEQMFKVDVIGVTTTNQRGKQRRHGAHSGRRSDWKKVYVSLKAGQDIDFAGGD